MRYKPERALTPTFVVACNSINAFLVEMRYKPERALTLTSIVDDQPDGILVEMRYKPERVLTHGHHTFRFEIHILRRNEV